MDIVAAAVLIVNAQNRFQIGEDILALHERVHHLGDDGRASHAPARQDLVADTAVPVADDLHRHVVILQGGAVMRRGADRDLELAGEEREFRMQAGPLPDDFGERPGIFDFLGRGAGEMIGGDVANAIAGGLDAMHLHIGKFGENIGHVHQLDPIELDVGPGGEMAEALVVFAGDVRELAQLPAGERAVGNGDAQHIGVKLKIEAVHQPERLELILGQGAGEPPINLMTELPGPLRHEGGVEFVIPVHGWLACRCRDARWGPGCG